MTSISRSLIALAIATAVLAVACGGDGQPTSTEPGSGSATTPTVTTTPPDTTATTVPLEVATTPPAGYEDYRAQTTACGAEPPAPATPQTFTAPDDLGLDPAAPVRVRIETSCGDLIVELVPSAAPATVNSFVFLTQQGYFDGTASHRILPGFVLQAGDPTATGLGSPGYTVPDEFPPADFVYARGVLAMANAGPGTTGSQFFVMLADAGLPPQYSVFGRVVEGDDVLDRIAAIPLGDRRAGFGIETSVPLETLYLERVVVES